jgi:hypothetical protein
MANHKLYTSFNIFEQSFFDSLQERFKFMNPWLSSFIKTNSTYHGYMGKIYEQLTQRVDVLKKVDDFNSYKSKLFDFENIRSFVENVQAFESSQLNKEHDSIQNQKFDDKRHAPVKGDSNSNSSNNFGLTPNSKYATIKDESKPNQIIKSMNSLKTVSGNKSYQNFEKHEDAYNGLKETSEANSKNNLPSLNNIKSSKSFNDNPSNVPPSNPLSNKKRISQDEDFLTFDSTKPVASLLVPKKSSESNFTNISTDNPNVNMFGLPKNNTRNKANLKPLNVSGTENPFNNASDIISRPNNGMDKSQTNFSNNPFGYSGHKNNEYGQFESTYTPNPKSQSFNHIKEFTPRSSSKDHLLDLNFEPPRRQG